MKYQPNRDYNSNDLIQTPRMLAKQIVEHFQPKGKILEPCCGKGNFLEFMPGANWCEIEKGRDFFDYDTKVDWIVTNPPWSKIRKFLKHSYEIADNVVFLMTINHIWTRARLRDMQEAGFGIKEILLLKTPNGFPQSGFQLGCVHLRRSYKGDIKITNSKKGGNRG